MPEGEQFHEVQLERDAYPAPAGFDRAEGGKVLLFECIDVQIRGIAYKAFGFDNTVALVSTYQFAFMVKSINS